MKEESESDPWERRDEFSGEVDEEAMADDASRYAAAAAEARNATELGEIASQEAGESSEFNGTELIERAQRDELTSSDLGNNGETMERVTTNILRAIGAAQDALDETEKELDGAESDVEQYAEAAEETYEEFATALSEMPPPTNDSTAHVLGDALTARGSATAPPPLLIYNGLAYTASGSWEGGWSVPDTLISTIRSTHMDLAVERVERADNEVTIIINQYRHDLGQLATDLEADGYDTARSSLELWNTEEMAVYNGERLNNLLTGPNAAEPDPELLYQYTLALNGTLNQMYDSDGNPLSPVVPGAAESVRAFLDQLDEAALLALGGLDGEAPGRGAEQIAAAQRAVSNGIIASMDPGVGGVNPEDIVFDENGRVVEDKSPVLPAGVAEYVYNLPQDLPGMDRTEEGGDMREALERFGSFGNLMGQATVSPADGFAADLADAAVSVQTHVDRTNNHFDNANSGATRSQSGNQFEALENLGSSGLLAAAAHNEKVAAEKLADEEFAERVTLASWDDDTGSAAFVRSGTMVPDHVDPMSDAASDYYEAAYNVLSIAGANSGSSLLGEMFAPPGRGEHLDETATPQLMAALGDVMVEHMAIIGQNADPGSGFYDTADEPFDASRLGEDVRYGFSLSAGETDGLFTMMNRTEDSVRDDFHSDVATWQYETALEGFESGSSGTAVATVARVAGHMDTGLLTVAREGVIDAESLRLSSIVGIATIGRLFPGAGLGPVLMFTGISEMGRHAMPEFSSSTADLEEYVRQNGDVAVRHIVAEAAYQSGMLEEEAAENWENRTIPEQPVDIEGFGDEDREPSPLHTELRNNVDAVEGDVTGGYPGSDQIKNEYDRTFDPNK